MNIYVEMAVVECQPKDVGVDMYVPLATVNVLMDCVWIDISIVLTIVQW